MFLWVCLADVFLLHPTQGSGPLSVGGVRCQGRDHTGWLEAGARHRWALLLTLGKRSSTDLQRLSVGPLEGKGHGQRAFLSTPCQGHRMAELEGT